MKFALLYPPDYDGELHLTVEDKPNGPRIARTVTVTISVDPEELPKATLRALGQDLFKQPLRRREA